ncbi:MAG: transposase, partial [Oxalobacter sp.]|nr:transposase [Oxalobacter sp.]
DVEGNVRLPEPNTKDFLPHFALANLAMKCGIKQALKELYGEKKATQFLDTAIYQLLDKGSADCFEEWAVEQYLPEASAGLNGRKISSLLQGVSEADWDRYWRLRFEHAAKEGGGQGAGNGLRYLAFDSTSISTYAAYEHAAYGHAKQNPELRQVNLAVVMDQFSGDLVYAFFYEGSINDKASYSYILERMKGAGFPMDAIMLVTDRGYYNSYTANELLNEGVHYLSGVPIARNSTEEKWIIGHGHQMTKHPMFRDAENGVYCYTLTEKWKLRYDPQKLTYTHIYYNSDQAKILIDDLNDSLVTNIDALNQGITVDRKAMETVRPYLKEVLDPAGDPHKKPTGKWVFDDKAISRYQSRAGFFVIKSDSVPDPRTALRLYRMRGRIEAGFDQFKNAINGNRLRVQEKACRGKVLLYLIATSLWVKIRANLGQHRLRVPNTDIVLPGNSTEKLLKQMNRIKIRRNSSKDRWLCDMIPKRIRDYLRVCFQCGTPPKKFW